MFRYVVPNNLEWQAFPEIQPAHQIIQEILLVGEWSHCSINREGFAHSNTSGYRWYRNPDPWWLEIGLDCNGEWRIAAIGMNPDGSYERLEMR